MSEEKLQLSPEGADKLLACADGTAALLYLYILRSGSFSLTQAASVLRRSEAEIALASDTLRRLGLMETVKPLLPERELPEYTAQDIVCRAAGDGDFTAVVHEAERTLGRVLNSNDLRLLFGIYDHLGLPAGVMMLLLHYCVDEYREKNGAGRIPTMRYIEKEAWSWAEQEIVDIDSAEALIERKRAKQDAVEQVKAVLQLTGQNLVAAQRSYIEGWLEMGYTPEALAIAYERTVLSTNKLAWNYMDRIVHSWNEKHLYTPEEIETGDPVRGGGKKTPAAGETGTRADADKIAQMRRMIEHMNHKEG